jgi:hypothetical protein
MVVNHSIDPLDRVPDALEHSQHLFNVTLCHCQISFVQFVSCGSWGFLPAPLALPG